MRTKMWLFILVVFLFFTGCDNLRFAPSQAQKQNAWLHNRTAVITAREAKTENASQELQKLTELSEFQSRAFVCYFGLPKDLPQAQSAQEILSQDNLLLTNKAMEEASDRPEAFTLAESALELAIGISALFGGVFGSRAIAFLKQAKTKTKALEEIIAGNELFKKTNVDSVQAFKDAQQQNQSPQTRQIVAELKA